MGNCETNRGGKCVLCKAPDYGLIALLVLVSFAYVTFLFVVSQGSGGTTTTFLFFAQTALYMVGGALLGTN